MIHLVIFLQGAISVESGYISKTYLADGDQFNMEMQITVPPTSGQEILNIGFTPVEKVNFMFASFS